MAVPARPINAKWQQPEVPIVPIGAKNLVLPSHDWPALVAYCFSSDIRIFLDLGYLSDSFQNLTGNSSDWFSAKSLQKRFKNLALCFDLSDHLHLRGVQDRLGWGGCSSSHLVMGDSISNKISSGGGGPTNKSKSVHIYIYVFFLFYGFSLQKSNDAEIVLMELHH